MSEISAEIYQKHQVTTKIINTLPLPKFSVRQINPVKLQIGVDTATIKAQQSARQNDRP
jgi:hypothetical protein